MSLSQAILAELSRPGRSSGHGSSYAWYLIIRWVWSRIGWWTMVPVSAVSALGLWAKLPPRRKRRPSPPGLRRSRPAYRGIPPEER